MMFVTVGISLSLLFSSGPVADQLGRPGCGSVRISSDTLARHHACTHSDSLETMCPDLLALFPNSSARCTTHDQQTTAYRTMMNGRPFYIPSALNRHCSIKIELTSSCAYTACPGSIWLTDMVHPDGF